MLRSLEQTEDPRLALAESSDCGRRQKLELASGTVRREGNLSCKHTAHPSQNFSETTGAFWEVGEPACTHSCYKPRPTLSAQGHMGPICFLTVETCISLASPCLSLLEPGTGHKGLMGVPFLPVCFRHLRVGTRAITGTDMGHTLSPWRLDRLLDTKSSLR